MIAQPDELDLSLLLVTTEDASTMLSDEEELRRNIKQAVSYIIIIYSTILFNNKTI